jgi:hypothetical protein
LFFLKNTHGYLFFNRAALDNRAARLGGV